MFFFSEYLNAKFGRPLQRVPINLPFLCPQRKKTPASRCIFCPEDGALARHLSKDLQLEEQVQKGVEYVKRRYGADTGLIAYFQNYTSTNADPATLREIYKRTLSFADFSAVIVSTRPDCLQEEILDVLAEIAEKYELWVEIGVQSALDKTLDLVKRHHSFADVEDAVKRLHKRKIKTAAHIIIGLPGENMEDFRFTSKKIASLPFSGVKIHNLLILRKTELAKRYATDKNFVHPLNEYEYAEALLEFMKFIPPEWPVMRICTDANPADIIAPKWNMTKGQFIQFFTEIQADPGKIQSGRPKIITKDGSFTFYHPAYKEHYHTLAGASTEAEKKFIGPCEIRRRLEKGENLEILDIGFGLGYNAFSAIRTAEEIRGKGEEERGKGEEIRDPKIKIISLENDPESAKFAVSLFPEQSLEYEIAKSLSESGTWKGKNSEIKIIIGDARKTVGILKNSFDAVFLDAFSTEKNPELWTYDFVRLISNLMKKDAILATYSSAYPVRGALARCGFHIGESAAFGRKRGGTIASFRTDAMQIPLSSKEMRIIKETTTGLPYRDPKLCWDREKIIRFRKKTIEKLRRKKVPKWL